MQTKIFILFAHDKQDLRLHGIQLTPTTRDLVSQGTVRDFRVSHAVMQFEENFCVFFEKTCFFA